MRNYKNQMARRFASNAEWANYGNDGYDRAASGRWAAWMDAAKAVEAGEPLAELAARMEAKAVKHRGIAKGYAMDAYNPWDAGYAKAADEVVKALREVGVAA